MAAYRPEVMLIGYKPSSTDTFAKRGINDFFRPWEFVCPCCELVIVSSVLVDLLNEARALFDQPIRVTSGYRCPKHNGETAGAAAFSAHLLGCAADVQPGQVTGRRLMRLLNIVEGLGFGGIGRYDHHIHVDVLERRDWDKRTRPWS